jgi:hypothetical protein
MSINIAGVEVMKGEKRIKAIERDIGRQVVGRTWINILGMKRKQLNKKEFNKLVGRTLRFNSTDADQILDVLRKNGKVKVTRRRIKIV